MNELAIKNNLGIPSEHEIMVFHTMAEHAISSKLYGNIYKDKAAVMMIMLAARELGIPPCQALNGGLNLIQGKVEISARMMSALIRRAGHKIKIQESSCTQCVLFGTRGDTGETQSASFSTAEAQIAGLIKPGGGWTKWPKDMCFARALSRLARQLFSDVIGIGYIEGEISQTCDLKNSGVEEVINEHLQEAVEITVENEQEHIEKFLMFFSNDDRSLAMEWLKIVQKHFDWTTIQAIKEVLKDEKKMFDGFTSWKGKQKK